MTQGQVTIGYYRNLYVGLIDLLPLTGRDDVEGNPQPPSQKQGRPGILKDILWPVDSGQRSFAIDVKYQPNEAGLRPQIRIVGNAELGVTQDVVAVASSASGWTTIQTSVTVVKAGVLRVWREWLHPSMSGTCHWDNIHVT